LGEAPRGVRDRERGHDDAGVGVPEVDHVLRLRHIDAHQESGAVRPERRLQFRNRLTRVLLSRMLAMGFFLLCDG